MRNHFAAAVLLIGSAILAAPRATAEEPILNHAALPQLTDGARRAYDEFLTGNLPRAFAVSSNRHGAGQWGAKSLDEARSAALANCTKGGGTDCALYAEDLDIVWHGARPVPRSVPSELIAGRGYAFVPDARYFWHGPQAARGVYVWSHGRGDRDARGIQPQPHVRWFNNAGFDVVRFDRELSWDEKDRAAGWLRDGLARLRASGYRKVIAGGQSRGAWNSLQTLDTPGLADVVIAVSPAAHGTDPGSVILRQGPQLWTMLHDAKAAPTRVAFVQFVKDPYADDEDERIDKFRTLLAPRIGAFLAIDRPAGFEGHGAGASSAFNRAFGRCLLHFALDPSPPPSCKTEAP